MEKNNKMVGVVVVLIILLLGTLVCLGYGYVKYTELNSKYSDLKSQIKEQENEVTTQNTYSIDDVACTIENNICTKTISVKYNNEDHTVLLKQKTEATNLERQKQFKTEVYIDNELVNTIDNGTTDISKANTRTLIGNIYIFNDKYPGILINKYENGKAGYYLYIYKDNKLYNETPEQILFGYNFIIKKDSEETINTLDKYEFDGTNLQYWKQNCENKNFEKMSLSFDGSKITKTKIEDSTDMYVSGASACNME